MLAGFRPSLTRRVTIDSSFQRAAKVRLENVHAADDVAEPHGCCVASTLVDRRKTGCIMLIRLVPAIKGKSIRLDKPVLLIGRNPDCDVVLKSSRKVSRLHCLLAVADNRVIVRDLNSTNGVWINGHRVERERGVELGDEIAVADVLYYLISEEAAAEDVPDASQQQDRATLDEPSAREALLRRDLEQARRALLEAGLDLPVAIPDEDDSFAVEPSMPQLPQISHISDGLEERRDGRDGPNPSESLSSSAQQPDASSSDLKEYFASAGDDSDDGIAFDLGDD